MERTGVLRLAPGLGLGSTELGSGLDLWLGLGQV